MKLLVRCFIPALMMYLVAASTAQAGQLENQLIDAAKIGNVKKVRSALAEGANVNAKDNDGHTALIYAAGVGHADVAKLLLDKGANIEAKAKDKWGGTALIYAAMYGNADVVKLLLDKGANIEAKDNNGETALFWAAESGYADTVKLLLDRCANIEAKEDDGSTALMEVAGDGKTDIVKLLLDKGANIEAKANNSKTALMLAVENEHEDVALLLAFEQGLAAARQQDWTAAAGYFEQGYKFTARRKEPPALLFNLGLAESKIPGRELRAILWFKLYLHRCPNAANAGAVRQELADLRSAAESTLDGIDGLINEMKEPMKELASHLNIVERARYAGWIPGMFQPCSGNYVYPDFENEWEHIKQEMDCEKDFSDIQGTLLAISRRREYDDPGQVLHDLSYVSDALHSVLKDLSRLGN